MVTLITLLPGYDRLVWGIAVLVMVMPVAIRLVLDRRLGRDLEDPLLPERLLGRRGQAGRAAAFVGMTLVLLVGKWAALLIPLFVVLDLAASFPLRRRLYDETWSLPRYLWFFLRLPTSGLGLVLLLGFLPWVDAPFGTPRGTMPSLVGALLLCWTWWSTRVTRTVMGTQPLKDARLLEIFDGLVARSGIPAPRFEYIDLRGGAILNAVALASPAGCAVVFTDTLLAHLETDEIVAVCAHEIAHLEYYDPGRLRRWFAARALLVVLGASMAAFVPPRFSDWTIPAWILAVTADLLWRARNRQRNETLSDQRAVALTGLPEALATGLSKLHTFARMPRRFGATYEQRATHPSLARRIRDIRAAAGLAPLPLADGGAFAAPDGVSRVVFAPEHLQWIDRAGIHQFAYDTLTELRVAAQRGAAARLLATDASGRRWEMPVEPTEVRRLQSVLDRVDIRLAPAPRPSRARRAAPLVALIAFLLALPANQLGAALVAVLALAAPAAPFLAAAGAACLAGAALAARDAGPLGQIVPLASCGVALVLAAWFSRRDARPERATRAGRALVLATLASLPLLLAFGRSSYQVHQAARTFTAPAVLLLALAAFTRAGSRRVPAKAGALLAAAAGLGAAVLGSTLFLSGVVHDPLLVRAPAIALNPIRTAVRTSLTRPFAIDDVTLSPGGTSIIAWRGDEDDDDADRRDGWTAEILNGAAAPVRLSLDDAVFTAEDRLLGVFFNAGGADVRELTVRGMPVWHVRIEGITSGRLTFDRVTLAWSLGGFDAHHHPVRADGVVGTPGVRMTSWNAAANSAAWALETSNTAALAFEKHYAARWSALGRIGWYLPGAYASTAQIWRLETGSAPQAIVDSQLDAMCQPGIVPERLVCAAFDGTTTRLSAIAVATGHVLPIGTLDGRFTPMASHTHPGWVTGWYRGGVVAIRGDSLEGVTAPPIARSAVTAIDANYQAVAIVRRMPGGSTIEIHPAAMSVASRQ